MFAAAAAITLFSSLNLQLGATSAFTTGDNFIKLIFFSPSLINKLERLSPARQPKLVYLW
jgi:hypothetical protein